jgi:hypothetical protein
MPRTRELVIDELADEAVERRRPVADARRRIAGDGGVERHRVAVVLGHDPAGARRRDRCDRKERSDDCGEQRKSNYPHRVSFRGVLPA